MADITLDKAQFRLRFPQFAEGTAYPDTTLDTQWIMGAQYVSVAPCGSMALDARTLALQYMLAHLLGLAAIIATGAANTGLPGITISATIDKISVTLAQPPYGTSPWRYWMNLTPYGAALLALLDMQAAGGFYIGGLPERAAFRKVGGIY